MQSIKRLPNGNFSIEFAQADLPSVIPEPTPPASSIDLTNWKLTLPVGSINKPTEILQPQLNTYQNAPYFISKPVGMVFRAPVNGVTTSGSGYPRSELREMKGASLASWSSSVGVHMMVIEGAITHLPLNKKEVVFGQIHDANDDVIVFRLEDKKLWVNVGGKNVHLLTDKYELGTKIRLVFKVQGDKTYCYYNGEVTIDYTLDKKYSGAYFKAGCYTQSNCTKETVCSPDNYGETLLFKLEVTHS